MRACACQSEGFLLGSGTIKITVRNEISFPVPPGQQLDFMPNLIHAYFVQLSGGSNGAVTRVPAFERLQTISRQLSLEDTGLPNLQSFSSVTCGPSGGSGISIVGNPLLTTLDGFENAKPPRATPPELTILQNSIVSATGFRGLSSYLNCTARTTTSFQSISVQVDACTPIPAFTTTGCLCKYIASGSSICPTGAQWQC